jgi:DNA-directed RNA polymerase subunit F
MSDAAQIYIELGDVGAEKYADLVKEEDHLLLHFRQTGQIDNNELMRIRNEIYQLRQDARIVSQR